MLADVVDLARLPAGDLPLADSPVRFGCRGEPCPSCESLLESRRKRRVSGFRLPVILALLGGDVCMLILVIAFRLLNCLFEDIFK
jgi:hypothetical protein